MKLHEFYDRVTTKQAEIEDTITHGGKLQLREDARNRIEAEAVAAVGAELVDAGGQPPYTPESFTAEIDAYLALSHQDTNDALLRGAAIASIIEDLDAPAG